MNGAQRRFQSGSGELKRFSALLFINQQATGLKLANLDAQ